MKKILMPFIVWIVLIPGVDGYAGDNALPLPVNTCAALIDISISVIDTPDIVIDTSISAGTSAIVVDTSVSPGTSAIVVEMSTLAGTPPAYAVDEPAPSPFEGLLKFGRRVAYNNSSVTGVRARVYSFDGETLSYTTYGNEVIHGSGFEAGGIIFFVLTEDVMALNIAPAVLVRRPLSTRYAAVGEIALSIPVLLEWRPYGALPLHALIGVQPGVPLYTWLTWSDEPNSTNREPGAVLARRMPVDFGVVMGAGWYLNERVALDARAILGLAGFDRAPGRRLNQFTVGISYIH
ncbi:MAG: PorT family protein [Chitinispirillia bacterium]|nr:PorT family protein [Chitinispirillia bacterium]MCL2268214.1 PorT family protein [Chitinispirillia bacterium]